MSDHIAKTIELYTSLPPPSVHIIPFSHSDSNCKQEMDTSPEFNIDTREDFELLKKKTIDYIERLDQMLDELFGRDPKEYIAYHSYMEEKKRNLPEKKSTSQSNIENDKPPTRIQYLKALNNASEIIEEVKRSRAENKLKKEMAHLQQE
jgi:hypothetical protein